MERGIHIKASLRFREKGDRLEDDVFQATVTTRNPDQTGLMAHARVRREDLETFWDGVDAVARTWVPEGVKRPEVPDRMDSTTEGQNG